MAHIQKVTTKGGKVRFQGRYIDPAGKERAKNFDTMRDAREYLVRVESAKLRREWLDPSLGRRTFAECAQKVEASRINLRDNPRLRDAWVVGDLILPTFGDLAVASIDDELVQRWVMKLVEEGYAPSTVRKAYQTSPGSWGRQSASGSLARRAPGSRCPPTTGAACAS